MRTTVEGFTRIEIWDPMSAFVAGVGGRQALRGTYGSATEEKYLTRSGALPRSRTRPFALPLIDTALIEHLRVMRFEGCPVRLVALGRWNVVWQEATRMELLTARSERPQFANEAFSLQSPFLHAAIWDSDSLIAGIPWLNTVPVDIGGGDYEMRSLNRPGYQGPYWIADADTANIDECAGLVMGDLELTMELPIGGATVQLIGEGVTGTIEALAYPNWNGASFDAPEVLASSTAGGQFYLPKRTWSIRITVDAAAAQPRLIVLDPGTPLGLRTGEFRDCEPAQSLCWPDFVDVKVFCPRGYLVSYENAPPYLVDDSDLYLDVLAADEDGKIRVTQRIQDDEGDDITISNIDFAPSGITSSSAYEVETISAQGVDGGATYRDITFAFFETFFPDNVVVTISSLDSAGFSSDESFTVYKETP